MQSVKQLANFLVEISLLSLLVVGCRQPKPQKDSAQGWFQYIAMLILENREKHLNSWGQIFSRFKEGKNDVSGTRGFGRP